MQIIICDQNDQDLAKYKSIIQNIAKEKDLDLNVITYSNVMNMLFDLEDIGSQVNLIYLENEFDQVNSSEEVVKKIRKLDCHAEIVFLTNTEEQWPVGYDVGAFHYLLKEKDEKKFYEVFNKVLRKIEKKDNKVMSFVYAGEKITVELGKISYFESNGRMITVHYGDDKEFEFYSRLTKIENTLLPEGFLRTHRSFVVNKTVITDYKNGTIILKSGEVLPVNRNMQTVIKNYLKTRK